MCLYLRGKNLWFQQEGTPAQYGEDARQWLNVTYPGTYAGSRGPIAWPTRLSDMFGGYFSVETPEGAGLCSPSRECRYKALSSCDNGRCQHVEGVLRRIPGGSLPSALKWTDAILNIYCNYPMVWSLDSLCHMHLENYTSQEFVVH
jgi:hypothetical protein